MGLVARTGLGSGVVVGLGTRLELQAHFRIRGNFVQLLSVYIEIKNRFQFDFTCTWRFSSSFSGSLKRKRILKIGRYKIMNIIDLLKTPCYI